SAVRRADYVVTGAIAAGTFHSLAVKADGSVWAWGSNSSNQVSPTGGSSATPLQVVTGALAGTSVVGVAAGASHSLALGANGSVYGWGGNGLHQLGSSTTTPEPNPIAITGLTSIVAIASGTNHNIALASNGAVFTWGDNSSGQIGKGTSGGTQGTPWQVSFSGSPQIVAVAAGGNHCLALQADGSVWTWGQDNSGQLGDGGSLNRTSPYHVTGLSGLKELTGGLSFSMALRADGQPVGAVWTWGANASGQLGDGTTTNHSVPAATVAAAWRVGT